MEPKQYQYGEDVIINGQNLGQAKFDTKTGKALTPTTQPPNNQSQVITSEALKPVQPVNVPVAPVAPVDPVAPVAPTFTNEADRILQESEVEDTEAQQLGNKLSERIFSSLQNLTGEQQALGEAQKEAGVGQFKKQLQDINSQILKKQAELQQDDIRLIQSVQNLEQQKIPMEFITGQQQSVQRDAQIARALKASEIGILNASALATQGNIALAMETAQQAVDLKYAPYKEEIALYKSQLEALAPILSRDEKKQAREQELKADLALKDLDKRQKNDEALQNMLVTASSQNAPMDLLNRAKNAKTPSEAAMILGQYAGDYYAIEKMKLELNKLRGGTTGTGGSIGGGVGREVIAGVPIESPAYSWLDQYNAGSMSLEDIYTKIGSSKTAEVTKNQLSKLVAAQGGKRVLKMDDTQIAAINDQIKNINDLLGDSGYNYKVISGAIQGGALGVGGRVTGAKGDALAIARNLVSNQTLQALADAKAKGVTFGALSEAELNAVANSASRIASKIIKNEAGEITGFSGSEKGFKDDLLAIKKGLEKSIQAKTGSQVNKQVDLADKVLNQIGEEPVTGGYIFK